MVKYRLHNITDFGVELHDFYTENSLNNYIALFVDTPYWVENLETHENVNTGFDGNTETHLCNENTALVTPNKLDDLNISRETLHQHKKKEPYTKLEKISYLLSILSVIIMATFLLYLFLSSVSFIAEHFSEFTWKVFNIL